MPFFDPEHPSWVFIIGPAIVVAAAIALDNRLRGPYFAIVDVVFGDFGSGYHWYDKEILLSFVRRVAYIIGVGLLLNAFHYRLIDVAAVFLVAGFLMIWPAFGHPLPVPARKSDWHVLAVWAAYVASVVLFGLFGGSVPLSGGLRIWRGSRVVINESC